MSLSDKMIEGTEPAFWKKDVKEFIQKFERYLKRQNFNGTTFNLKKNILTKFKEEAGDKLSHTTEEATKC